MFELSATVAGLANLCFGGMSIYLSHSLNHSPRKWWQCALAWFLVLVVSTVGGELLDPLFPQLTHERIQAFLGFDAIFVYFYLFRNIPPAQRMFTYFLVDNSIYLTILTARTVAMALARLLPLSADALFLVCFLLLAAGGLGLFHLRLKKTVLAALASFRQHLGGLAAFAAICYIATLLLADAWSPWFAMTLPFALRNLSIAALALSGYVLAFRTLTVLRAQDAAEDAAKHLAEQFAQSERYYESMVEQIDQTRIHTHDLHHHVDTISALCQGEDWGAVREYAAALSRDLPRGLPRRYCALNEVNAMLDHYAHLCDPAGVPLDCRVELAQNPGAEPLHLCIILGNALENALEASRGVSDEKERFIAAKVVGCQGRIAISVSNRFSGSIPTDEEGRPRSTKQEPGHGLGLTSIRQTAQRYGGWCGTKIEGDIFTLLVTLECAT